MSTPLSPTQIIILGGSGDLSRRKLLPALLDLYSKNQLPRKFQIVGLARTPRTDEEYRELVKTSLAGHAHSHTPEEVADFCKHLYYVTGSFDAKESYQALQTTLSEFQSDIGVCTNRLFYLAVPPQFYSTIFKQLHTHNMNEPCDQAHGWTRILVEKPFGSDYQSAQALDENLSALFREEQIFRIDHYLAKEAVQNILSFRFANPLLTPAWNHRYIESIAIEMKETIDVGARGSFYEDVGALRDVGQNHLLQVLALITMNQPVSFDAEHIRRERAYILGALRPYNPKTCDGAVVRAQYEGFLETEGIECDSETETYFELVTHLDTDDWKDVPIYITAGKGLNERKVTVTVTFKEIAGGLFEDENFHVPNNKVVLTLNPNLDIDLSLNSKKPGYSYRVEPDQLSFACRSTEGAITNSYEKVLLDCIYGDQTLFTSTDEVLAAWKYITSILEKWQNIPMQTYQKGSAGPEKLAINT